MKYKAYRVEIEEKMILQRSIMSSISNLETKSKVIVISSCTWWESVGEKDKLGQLD